METVPGLAVLVVAIVVVGIVIWLRLSGESEPDTAAGEVEAPTTQAADAAPVVGIELDPHAGAEVLPPRGMPAAPAPAEDGVGDNPVAAAVAFAAQACAYLPGESAQEYQERLLPLSTPEVAASWEHGSAQRVHCMQLSGALTSADPATPVVNVAAVQVYQDRDFVEGMRAYRWAATVSLAPDESGWQVTA